MTELDDYEEGEMLVEVRDKAWKFWLPKTVAFGKYTRIGSVIRIHIKQVPTALYYKLPHSLYLEKEDNESNS